MLQLNCLIAFCALFALPSALAQSIIPQPTRIEFGAGEYQLDESSAIWADDELISALTEAQVILFPAMGIGLNRAENKESADMSILYEASIPVEGYKIEISEKGISIAASSGAGAFYAMQSIRQLLPAQVFSSELQQDTAWTLPYVTIEDQPRFGWRGMHMDVSRHFMPVESVKRFIDAIAAHKYNRFHWHLTDDQGWRIEIKKYPKLTDIGACRRQTVINVTSVFQREFEYDGIEHCGHYSQAEIAEIVSYAADRYITIVPEIEFPGHSQAAIYAYPELGVLGSSPGVKEEWGISPYVLNPRPETLEFYKDVFDEVMDLFPSQYIHVGGDEAPKTHWKEDEYSQELMQRLELESEYELQAWMVSQIHEHLRENGRVLIGWDEILQGKLVDTDAAVMAWRGMDFGVEAINRGHDVVMAPFLWTYYDAYQGDFDAEPTAIFPSYTPLEKAYRFDPVPEGLTDSQVDQILGAQGQLWTEYIPDAEHLEYMAFPRASALSEVLWSESKKPYDDFLRRLEIHLNRLDQMGVNYRPLGNDGLSDESQEKFDRIMRLARAYMDAQRAKDLGGEQ